MTTVLLKIFIFYIIQMGNFFKKGGWILVAIVVVALWVVSKYNGLVALDESVKLEWSNVETQYQRRADLIPNLVNTVKGFAGQELEVFTEVTRARAAATQTTVNIDDPASVAQFQAAQGDVSSALARLLVTVEAYPELKSDQNFLDLQTQLEGTENRISTARTRYNEVVMAYNTATRSFPTNIAAALFGFPQRTGFEAEEGADQAPTVDFGDDDDAEVVSGNKP